MFIKDNKEKGFTLVEVIVSIGIFALMMGAISALFITLYRSQKNDIALIERTRLAGFALEKMSDEIRRANRAENGNFHLAITGGQNIVFYSDIDADGLTEKIAYELEGTNINRTVVEPGTNFLYQEAGVETVLCAGVRNGSNPIFLYYDEDYTGNEEPMSSPVDNVAVRVVGISLDVNTDNSGLATPFHLGTKVQIRNLK